MNGSGLLRGDTTEMISLSLPCKDIARGWPSENQEEKPPSDLKSVSSLLLDLPGFRTVRNKGLLLNPSS